MNTTNTRREAAVAIDAPPVAVNGRLLRLLAVPVARPAIRLGRVDFTTMSTNFYGFNDYTLTGTGQYLLIGAAVTPFYGDSSALKATPDAFKIQTLTVSAVPEPASLLLIGFGLLAVGVFSNRRNLKSRL